MQSLIPAGWRAHGMHPVRSAIGAGIAIALTAWVSAMVLGTAAPFMVASMGASSVLAFAVPASPLAQPRAVLGGNVVSAITGVAAAKLMPDPIAALGLAAALAIYAMHKTKTLHPPGGAVALIAVMGGAPVHQLGFLYVLAPVAFNSVLLLSVAWWFNNLAGSPYPHRPEAIIPPAPRLVTEAEIAAVLDQMEDLPDIDPADLLAIVNAVEVRKGVVP